jgi:hypothetical protein
VSGNKLTRPSSAAQHSRAESATGRQIRGKITSKRPQSLLGALIQWHRSNRAANEINKRKQNQERYSAASDTSRHRTGKGKTLGAEKGAEQKTKSATTREQKKSELWPCPLLTAAKTTTREINLAPNGGPQRAKMDGAQEI